MDRKAVAGVGLYSTRMRIACLQFDPQVGEVSRNVHRADAILQEAVPGELDLLMLPELAFSGIFNSVRCTMLLWHWCKKLCIFIDQKYRESDIIIAFFWPLTWW